jgi:hypothetical protein
MRRWFCSAMLFLTGTLLACLCGCPLGDVIPGPVAYYGTLPGT